MVIKITKSRKLPRHRFLYFTALGLQAKDADLASLLGEMLCSAHEEQRDVLMRLAPHLAVVKAAYRHHLAQVYNQGGAKNTTAWDVFSLADADSWVYALFTLPPPFCAMGEKVDFVSLVATMPGWRSGDQW